jgi:tetratricopeptide (TPR) repeat protein
MKNVRLCLASLLLLAPVGFAQSLPRTVEGKESKVKTDLDEATATAVAARIDEYCTTFQAFYDGLGMTARKTNTIVLRLFSSFDDFSEFREKDNATSSWNMYSSESLNAIVAYYDPDDSSLASKLFGLCSNMYLRRYVTDAPSWIQRGYEALFSGYTVEKGRPVHPDMRLVDLVVLQDALRRNEFVPLSELVKRNEKTFCDRPPKATKMHNLLPDSEAWGLVHYLLVLAPDNEREMFRQYMKGLNAKGAKASDAKLDIADWPKFEERWKQAILAIDPKIDTAAAHMRVGDGHMEVLNYSFAAPEYEAAYKIDPKLPGLAFKMGYTLKRMGKYEPAVWYLEKAIATDPASALPHYQLARMYAALDVRATTPNPGKPDPAKALEHAQKAVELGGADRPIYLEVLARCQAVTGDKKAAVLTARKALLVAEKEDKAKYEKLLSEIQKGK